MKLEEELFAKIILLIHFHRNVMAEVRNQVRNYGMKFSFIVLVRYGSLGMVRNYGMIFLSYRNYDIFFVPYRTATLGVLSTLKRVLGN